MEWTLTGLPLPLILRPPSPFTDDDLLLFSRQNRTFRIEKNTEGELIILTPLGESGGRWEASVIGKLSSWAELDGRGQVFSSNTGFNLSDGSTLSPDASWVSNERWYALSPKQRQKFPPLCPEFVIEVRSGTDRASVLCGKMELWIANGAQLAWMIDPRAASLTIYRPGRNPEVLQRPDAVEAEAPVDGFRLTLRTLWAEEEHDEHAA